MRIGLILLFWLITAEGMAQVRFRTQVPKHPVAVNESFQVEYIIEDADKVTTIKPPPFTNFRLVAGPNTYIGSVSSVNGIVSSKNFVYTLEAIRPGNYIIPGASLVMDGRIYRSNDVKITVAARNEPDNHRAGASMPDWNYTLAPGENAQEKIKQNLFVKVAVDKKKCYAGEPVLATFKLYSCLQSKSDIAKNPGFYGFSVFDIINLQDNVVTTESLNGKLFDVHTIRKVLLYPLQAGMLTIDAMEILNRVEFSKSVVNKKTEQDISEGLLNKRHIIPAEGIEVYETTLRTEPVNIAVKPVPDKGKPAAYSGATGHFAVLAGLSKDNIAKNEEGFLEIVIKGKGNFIQLDAPSILWPAGMEGFAPVVKDSFDKAAVPLQGSRTFRYPFICSNPGSYTIPAVSFSFFDTDSNSFKTVSTPPLPVTVSNTEIKNSVQEESKTSIAAQSKKASRIAIIIVVSLVLLVLAYIGFIKKDKPVETPVQEKRTRPAIDDLLQPAYTSIKEEPGIFYKNLHQGIWNFLHQFFGLAGSGMNKQWAQLAMQDAGIDAVTIQQLLDMLMQCEAGIFTNARLEDDKQALWQQSKEMLEKIAASSA
jgi:BatD DUF11 like domain